ncbi:MAG TPA: 30S ribosomal protein S12 methylthiotransferase RimO [Fibrobacteria bacterium]|nr:30S ribosomal protein S12 methylthiotransferase RimO [Fibrobacteria bacterium]
MPKSAQKPASRATALPRRDRKVRIVNLGCSKNQVDSESILGEFGRAGFTLAGDGDRSEITVVNTCGFIEAAKEESVNEILAALDQRRGGEKVVVAGCLSQRYLGELHKEIPEADLLVGTYKPGEILDRLGLTSTLPSDCVAGAGPRTLMGEESHHAFLKIAEGCNRICGFCAIPGMRGKQRSRSIADIVAEAQQLQSWGIKEVSLIAQDLTYFGREKNGTENLEDLLRALIRETDIPWFRMMYAYPAFLTEGLLDVMATEKRVCKYLDMPVQHASDRMLKAMRRNYSAQSLRKQLADLRSSVPGIALRTTVVLGYPGETEEDVEELLALVEETRFRHLGGFTYSDEEGTHAFDLKPKVAQDVMDERLGRVMQLQGEIAAEDNQARVGETVEVVIDAVAEGETHHYVGRTEGDAPEVDGRVLIHGAEDAEPGTFRKVFITGATAYDLEGTFAEG